MPIQGGTVLKSILVVLAVMCCLAAAQYPAGFLQWTSSELNAQENKLIQSLAGKLIQSLAGKNSAS